MAVDRAGAVVWQRELPFAVMECRVSLQNTLLVMTADGRAVEMGFNGDILHQWYCRGRFPKGTFGVGLATQGGHHSIQEIAPDLYLSLSVRQHAVAVDTVVVFDRKGEIHQQWDVLRPEKTGVLQPVH